MDKKIDVEKLINVLQNLPKDKVYLEITRHGGFFILEKDTDELVGYLDPTKAAWWNFRGSRD